ncbi:MAG: ion transporter [Bacteroidales bacterium]|nr:ion transporter [Bacteroidales bacterium]MBN2748716.1 ion transporter [Bacteroidales bacterium]
MISKARLYNIIFENHTKEGKRFDVALLWLILVSIVVAIIDSVPAINHAIGIELLGIEWLFTALFSIEYATRIIVSKKPNRYIFSFWGIIDLLAILPTYLSIFSYGYHYLLVVRIFRLLRVFRILRLAQFNKESITLLRALKASLYKIGIFFSSVVTIVVLLGTIMYVVEDGNNGFTSIPQSIYWAIITITTVGYGDIVPHTIVGKFIASVSMIIGYAIIAVPTGIVTVEMSRSVHQSNQPCPNCGSRNNDNANFCSNCGNKLTNKE